ncbi:MAG: alpha/beta fold hydrolase [Marinobacter sp.]
MDWILLRGLAREQAHWGAFRERLQSRCPGHRFHVIDLPGTGSHYRETSPATIAGIRQQVQHYARHIPGPVGLFGLSMGGMVALDWAQAEPQRVARLVLLNTSTGFSPSWRRLRPAALVQALTLLWRRDVAGRERGILRLTSNRPVCDTLAYHWLMIQCQRPVRVSTAIAQLRAAAGYRPAAEPPPVEALLLASTADRIVHWHCSRALARRWQWPLRTHADAGHDLVLDAPDWVLEQFQSVA